MSSFEDALKLQEIDLTRLPPGLLNGLKRSSDHGYLKAQQLRDNEVWIIQCPQNVKLASLLEGKRLRLDRPTTLKSEDDESTFESFVLPQDKSEPGSIAAVLPDESGTMKLISVPLAGSIMIRETFEDLPFPTIESIPKKRHVLPSGIKERHPVYGVNFTKALASMDMDTDNSGIYEKKKYKMRKSAPYATDIKVEREYTTVLPSTKKKNKGKSVRINEESRPPGTKEDANAATEVRTKKKKQKRQTTELEYEEYNRILIASIKKDSDSDIVQKKKKHKKGVA